MEDDFIASSSQVSSARDVVGFLRGKSLRANMVMSENDPSDTCVSDEADANMVANCIVEVIDSQGREPPVRYHAYVEPLAIQV